ncbi:DNA (cytosine-5)-methyltransferase 1 [Stakelama sediminis]|uniref:Cytosine-specific methyltransferase n=1 Tax=Stakelama sediminis TaxID=463200 RepID=A0A840Z285_9SPHN|nr:DNA cytosine methyltransferase [Stakelama sediminis]MBB5720251.1 DNA (cytosine-5)-methyltransferase 1 [Stakelama sediminis]
MRVPAFVDLFAGCGGLSLGMQRAGWTLRLAVESHPDPFSTLKHNLIDRAGANASWPESVPCVAHDLRELLKDRRQALEGLAEGIELIVGGPPCQGFSTNGRRRKDDPRNQLVKSYLEAVELFQPKLLLIENVRGFTSMEHEHGTYSDFVAAQLVNLGYDVWTEIVTAAEWGVPQRRPRFLLIAALKGTLTGIDPFLRLRTARRRFLSERGLGGALVSASEALSDLEISRHDLVPDREFGSLGFEQIDYRSKVNLSAYQMLMRDGHIGVPTDLRIPRHTAAVESRFREILETCPRGRSISPSDRARLGIRKRATTPISPDMPSPTVTTLPDDMIHYSEPRVLTLREMARLQSFPDWFAFQGPYTSGGHRRRNACPRYTQVGNAVPPLLAEAVGEVLLGLLSSIGEQGRERTNVGEMHRQTVPEAGEVS